MKIKHFFKVEFPALFVAFALIVGMSGGALPAYASDPEREAETNVIVNLTSDGTMAPWKIIDDPTLRRSFDEGYTTHVIWNDIALNSTLVNVPLSTTHTLLSALDVPITITQTGNNVRHFGISGDSNITFVDVILQGNNINGGIGVSVSGTTTVTGLEVRDCFNGSGGGGIDVTGGGNLILNDSVITGCATSNSNNTNGGGGIRILSSSTVTMNGGELTNNTRTNNGAGDSGGGGVYLEGSGRFTSNNTEITGNSTNKDGGAIYANMTSARITINGGTLSNNTAGHDGGAIGFPRAGTANFDNSESSILRLTGSLTFGGNSSSKAYWIEKAGTHLFLNNSATALKTWYDTHVKSGIVSLSDPPPGTAPFEYVFNGFDVMWIGDMKSTVSPGDEKLIFDTNMVLEDWIYEGVASATAAQWLSLKNANKPKIDVYNTLDVLFSVKYSYDIFKVDGVEDATIMFGLRNAGNTYDKLIADMSYTLFTSENMWVDGFVHTVPWGDPDLLKVHIDPFRGDLVGKDIKTVVYLTLEVAP